MDLNLHLVAAEAAASKTMEETVVLDVGPLIGITDYFVITAGRNDRQVRTIVDEVTARVRAALRHRLQVQGVAAALVTGDLRIDLVQRLISRAGEPIKLSPKEFDILRMLATHAGKVLTHRFLLQEVWGTANAEDVQYLRAFIRLLRQKIEPHPDRPIYVVTETGVGYRLKMLDEIPLDQAPGSVDTP